MHRALVALAVAQNPPEVQRGQTGLLLDDVYLRHLARVSDHPERLERLVAIRDGLDRSGLLKSLHRITPRRATDEELTLVHSRAYLDLVRRELSSLRGTADLSTGDTLVSPGSLEAAQFAVGGVLNAVDVVMTKSVKNAFCAVRPPGHHATPTRGMGFCIYNNVAIAARYMQKTHGVKRVLIVDWDYHQCKDLAAFLSGFESKLCAKRLNMAGLILRKSRRTSPAKKPLWRLAAPLASRYV